MPITIFSGRLAQEITPETVPQGRGEPGSGTLDWQVRLDWLAEHCYDGLIGLEYRPTGPTVESLRFRA